MLVLLLKTRSVIESSMPTMNKFSLNHRYLWRADPSTHASTRSNQQSMKVTAALETASDESDLEEMGHIT